jgi:hypothetical protein
MKLKATSTSQGQTLAAVPGKTPEALTFITVVTKKRFKETVRHKRSSVFHRAYAARLQMKMMIYFEICSLILMNFLSK